MRRIALIVLAAALLSAPGTAGGQGTADPFPDAAASYLLKIDGKAVWEHLRTADSPPRA